MRIKDIAKISKNTTDASDFDVVDKQLFKLIDDCIKNGIKYELSEEEFISLINLYHKINHSFDFNYFKKIADNSTNKNDYYKVINDIDKYFD